MLRLAHVVPTHEEIFLERYERLLSAASTLTGGNREVARDLVHDAYVQFVLTRPPLEPIDRIDGYLFITVRNLHISRARRATRARHESLGIVDFDSASLGLHTLGDGQRFEAVDQLRRICQFALVRRWQARTASAFLLHYFHEYPPSHVALVLHTAPAGVRKLLWLARAEVRAALDGGPTAHAEPPLDAADVMAIRRHIFRAERGACPDFARVKRFYTGTGRASVDVRMLAHLVSCEACLGRVNALLGLPAVDRGDGGGSDRLEPPGTSTSTDTDTGIGTGTGAGTGAGSRPPRSSGRARRVTPFAPSERAITALREHRPTELRIAVNGLPIGMQRVAGPHNEVVLRLGATDAAMFIEVFSEQEVRLLLLNVEPLASGAARQLAQVLLSDDRLLQIELDLTDVQPIVRVTYRDPSLAPDIVSADALIEDTPSRFLAIAEEDEDEDHGRPAFARSADSTELVGRRHGSYAWRVFDACRAIVTASWLRARPLSARLPRRAQTPCPRRRVLQAVGAIAVVWLLLFQPNAVAAAATQAYRAVVEVVDQAWRWLTSPAPAPAPRVRVDPPPPPMPPVAASPTPAAAAAVTRVGALSKPARPVRPAFQSAELDAWYRAHLLGLTFDRDVRVTQTPAGQVQMQVRVENDYRRAALLARLDPWAHAARASLDIEVAAPSASPPSDVDHPNANIDANANANANTDTDANNDVDAAQARMLTAFTAHFATLMSTDAAEAAARMSVDGLRTQRDRQQALVAALRSFVTRWPAGSLEHATPDDVTHWMTVVRDHALSIGESAERLRTMVLKPLLTDASSASASAATSASCVPRESVSTIGEVEPALDKIFTATERLQHRLERRFEASPDLRAPDDPNRRDEPDRLGAALCDIEMAARAFAGPFSFIR